MKEKILIFIIGLLVGAVIATGGCLIYVKIAEKNNSTNQITMPGEFNRAMGDRFNGERPEMPDGNFTRGKKQTTNVNEG